MLEKLGMQDCKLRLILLLVGILLLNDRLEIERSRMKWKVSYHETLGLLIWL